MSAQRQTQSILRQYTAPAAGRPAKMRDYEWRTKFLRSLEARGAARTGVLDRLAAAYGEIALLHKQRGDRRAQGAASELAAEYRRKAQAAEITARVQSKGY